MIIDEIPLESVVETVAAGKEVIIVDRAINAFCYADKITVKELTEFLNDASAPLKIFVYTVERCYCADPRYALGFETEDKDAGSVTA